MKIQEIWNKLSTIDVNEDTETKGEFTYLPWNYAVDYIMKYTPSLENFDFDFLHYTDSNGMVKDYIVAPDGSCSVECVVDINGIKRKMYLAVTDFKNRPIKNPSCNDINNTRKPNQKRLRQLASALNCSIKDLYPQVKVSRINYYEI